MNSTARRERWGTTGTFLHTARVRLLAELRRGPPQSLAADDHESVRQKLLEILTRPDACVEERIEAARVLKAEFPFGTLLRAMFEEATH